MEHIKTLKQQGHKASAGTNKTLVDRATGAFYTHELIGTQLMAGVVRAFSDRPQHLKIIDPFCGDGRLVCWLLRTIRELVPGYSPRCQIDLWDCDDAALPLAHRRVTDAVSRLGLKADMRLTAGDSFQLATENFGFYHLVVTNPPWEVLKPDRRELDQLASGPREAYIAQLRQQDERLRRVYPLSQPEKKFSGWGTNLARCGVEAALRLASPHGVCGLVSPSSLLADQMSTALRRWVFLDNSLRELAYFPAEARLFERVDQPCVTLVAVPGGAATRPATIRIYNRDREIASEREVLLDTDRLERDGYVVHLHLSDTLRPLIASWDGLPTFADLEGEGSDQLWAGRELDETGHAKFLTAAGEYLFTKGRMVRRFGLAEQPTLFVAASGPRIPRSADFERVAWRDVARPSPKRRIHATLIPAGWVTGNSLNVAYFRDGDRERLKALLGVLNSFVFEFQVRANLATAHVSLGAVRRARLPDLACGTTVRRLASLVDRCLAGGEGLHPDLEVAVARLYGLSRDQFRDLLVTFDKLDAAEVETLLSPERWGGASEGEPMDAPLQAAVAQEAKIANHFTPGLSELDLRMVRAVPPGGNWKDIPKSVPSQRLEQIRVSFAKGEGSRSTYYGRLDPDAPSYTISTYFNRPGNGCHIHYDFAGGQHRVISQREAARLQSFPDGFVFHGTRGSVNKQIGNAVPPLLAFQLASHLAESLGGAGEFVDLFAGAGGLSLGFQWAGWKHLVANDIDPVFLRTYSANIHPTVVTGDIRDPAVFDRVASIASEQRSRHNRLFVIGGPPCQGFSTAGNRRSMEDERNSLFEKYAELLGVLKPDGYLFENVTGILNMEKGEVFKTIRRKLASQGHTTAVWTLRAEEYAVPQRRARVFVVGLRPGLPALVPPQPVTMLSPGASLFQLPGAITVRQALDDLPPLVPGEDGSGKDYVCPPCNSYQQFMRGHITASELLALLLSAGDETTT